MNPMFLKNANALACVLIFALWAADAAFAAEAPPAADSIETTEAAGAAEPAPDAGAPPVVAEETPAAEPAVPPDTALHGNVQAGYSQSNLTAGLSRWRDGFVRGNLVLPSQQGVVGWEVLQQNHFDESGRGLSLSLTRDLSERWYGMVGAGVGTSAMFLPSQRVDVALYRKWLVQRQLVTGLQFTRVLSGDRLYTDRTWQLSASYYFDMPLVAELGSKTNTSNPGQVATRRYYAAFSQGRDKQHYFSVRYDAGREGYASMGPNGALVDFKSTVWTATWRQWVSRQSGFELGVERYNNPSYRRNSATVSVFHDF